MELNKLIYPTRISFAGIDETVSINELKELTEYGKNKGLIIEFGVLLSSANDRMKENDIIVNDMLQIIDPNLTHEHTPLNPRYPSINYIKSLTGNGLNLSLHLCGKYTKEIMTTGTLDVVKTLLGEEAYNEFQRIQINVVGRKTKAPTLNLDKEIIIQTNLNEQHSADRFELYKSGNLGDVVFLSDTSGGRGESGNYQYYGTQKQGYAGGIRPENVLDVIKSINTALNGVKQEYWIDLESGCRVAESFSVYMCKAIIDSIADAKEKGV